MSDERYQAGLQQLAQIDGEAGEKVLAALAEGRDPGDLTTIEDPAALEQLQQALGRVAA